MIIGVKNGYEKKLEIIGVGYLAAIKGKILQLRVGFATSYKFDSRESRSDLSGPNSHHGQGM